MAIRILEDVVLGAQFVDQFNGSTALRQFVVTGLDQSTPSGVLYQARTAIDSVSGDTIPVYGNQHPVIPGIFVSQVTAVPLGDSSRKNAKVTVFYSWQGFSGAASVQATVQTTAVQVEANHDGYGNLFLASYVDPTTSKKLSNYVKLRLWVTHTLITITRIENTSPLVLRQAYAAKTNSDTFQGFDQFKVLCRNIGGGAIGSRKWKNEYVFEGCSIDDWVQIGFFEDPVTRVIPQDILDPTIFAASYNFAKSGQSGQPPSAGGGLQGNPTGTYVYQPPSTPFAPLNLPSLL